MENSEPLPIQPNAFYTVEETARLLRVPRRILGAALLNLPGPEAETETVLVSDWLRASSRSLREVWDNEEDAVYDQL